MFVDKLGKIIESLIRGTDKPVVVFSALWPFFKVMDYSMEETPSIILKLLQDVVGEQRGLLMPSFSSGYKNSLCNLDTTVSQNGILTDVFRQSPGVKRTLSAFFSFCISSENQLLTNHLLNLTPKFAWGDGSVYEWMEQEDVHFLMLGVHPTTCSYLHRMEWLMKEKINYRYNKLFTGHLIREGKKIKMEENLFVRSLDPAAINNFTIISDALIKDGMQVLQLDGVSIAHMRAMPMKATLLSLLERDPFFILENRSSFE